MPKSLPWEARWRRDVTRSFRGGQGIAFVATATDGSGGRAFIKTLQRRRDTRARARFRREAAAYETLAGLGPPRLIEHNADSWNDGNTPLYMALEYIEGLDLQTLVENGGPVGLDAALACGRELSAVLHRCHTNTVVHRDVKPANVVLRDGDITRPVLVDFGLSFNDAEEDDLTRVGEEVGNRFLRLPEHATGGRGAASDVTQLAGILLYGVSGCEPRVLLDEDNKMPHQRLPARDMLENALTPRAYMRVLSVFDRSFSTTLSTRYSDAPELISDREAAMRSDGEDGDELEDLLAQVDEVARSRGLIAQAGHRESMQRFMTSIRKTLDDFTFPRGLVRSQTGHKECLQDDEQWMETRYSVHVQGDEPTWAIYRVERRSGGDYVVLVDGAEVWRGESPEATLISAIQRAVAQRFLSAQSDS